MKINAHTINPEFSSDSFQDNLYLHYQQYLQASPVFHSDEGVVYLTRYNDCIELLSNNKFRRNPPVGGCNPFSETQRAQTPLEAMISHWMIFMDPPRHDIVRKSFMQPFSAKSIKLLEPFIQHQSHQLLEGLPQKGELELLENYAFSLPVLIIAKILGVPQSDTGLFRTWSALLTQALDTASEEDIIKGAEVALLFKEYFESLINRRHTLAADCLINSLANEQNLNLSNDEILYGCVFLLWSGHETTKNLIANGIKLLAEHPNSFAKLKQQPDLIENAVEEMLRFESPVQKISRWTHEDAYFGEHFVQKGTLITALIGAANRDPSIFQLANHFNIQRSKNRHIAFGSGIHHCLGAVLAKTEARIAFSTLLPRLNSLAPNQHKWRTYSAFRSLETLTVTIS